MFMKQVLFSIKLAEEKNIRAYRCIILAKSLGTFMAFYTLTIWVFHGLLGNTTEVKKFYISFKSFYDSASACS